ncbi:MAG: glycosyltransferase family 4 protein [Bacteroidales bacterium]|nr:glycosyltransferase family 4 protein [Bacteroidales bacterium]
MQLRFLFPCLAYSGHYLEYVNYQYHHAVNNKIETIFLLHPKSSEFLSLYEWPEDENVKIKYFTEDEVAVYDTQNGLRQSFTACKLLKKYDKIFNPDIIVSNQLISFYPAAIITPLKGKLRGIIYRIPRHSNRKQPIKTIRDWAVSFMLRAAYSVDCIWLLNDKLTPKIYNRRLLTKKFRYLPDPINPQNAINNSIKKPNDKIRFEHIGGLGERKGTFTILEAIKLMSPEEQQRFTFSISGWLNAQDELRFQTYVNEITDKTVIDYHPGIIELERFNELIELSDFILIPYENVESSSGILGHAALHHKPVIGPAKGLLGQLIQNYNLGVTIPQISPQTLKAAILNIHNFGTSVSQFDKYIVDNTIDKFASELFKH